MENELFLTEALTFEVTLFKIYPLHLSQPFGRAGEAAYRSLIGTIKAHMGANVDDLAYHCESGKAREPFKGRLS